MNAKRRRDSIENNKPLSEQHALIAVTKAIAVVAYNLYICLYLPVHTVHTVFTANRISMQSTNNKNVFIVKFIGLRCLIAELNSNKISVTTT